VRLEGPDAWPRRSEKAQLPSATTTKPLTTTAPATNTPIWSRGKSTDVTDLGLTGPTLDSFGADGPSRVYVTATDGGVYRLDPA